MVAGNLRSGQLDPSPDMNHSRSTPESEEIIHQDARQYFQSLLTAIDTARVQIDMETYIFEVAGIGRRLAEALSRAAERGVRVRLVTDGAGVTSNFFFLADFMSKAGVAVKVHHPLPWQIRLWPFSLVTVRGWQKLWYLISFINKRNHRKMLIVDHRDIWLGSFNISQKHLPKEDGGHQWRDTAIELRGTDTYAARTAFDANWNKWRRRRKKRLARKLPNGPFCFNFTRALRTEHRQRVISRIRAASRRVWITNAYFVPDAELLDALKQASQRGVDVRILLPGYSDVFFIPWISRFFYQQLLDEGIKIFEYRHGFLHAKTLLIDNWGLIGSSNFNRRSLLHDLEVDYILGVPDNVQRLELDFVRDTEDAFVLSQQAMRSYKRWQRYLGGILLVLIGYWV